MPTYRVLDSQSPCAFPISCWTEELFSCCPFPPLPPVTLPGPWTGAVVASPSHGRVAVRTASLGLQLPAAHSFQQKLSHLTNDNIPSAGGDVTEGIGPCESHKLFYISNSASTSDHQTWIHFQLLPVQEENVKKFLSKSSWCCPPCCPFFSFLFLWI